jgi:hypothetical protein
MPSVAALLEILRSGGRLTCHGHTLQCDPGERSGPGMLRGTNAYGLDYCGGLTRRYVRWWRETLIAGKDIGPVPPGADAADEFMQSFFTALGEQPEPEAAPEPPPYVPSRWAQRAVASRIIALLDADTLHCYCLSDVEHAVQRLRGSSFEHWRAHSHPDYPGLEALCGIRFVDMDRDVTDGLPNALLRVLGLDGPKALSALGDFAAAVIDRCARGVVPPSPPMTSTRPTGLRRLFANRAAA